MPRWVVQNGQKVRSYDEARLRRKLRHGDLSGAEMARRDGEEQWLPLFEQPIFREEVPTGDARQTARTRAITGFGSHLAVFVLVNLGVWVTSGIFPFWAIFWGIGLFFHGQKTLAAMAQTGGLPTGLPARGGTTALPEPIRAPAAQNPTQSDFLKQVHDAVATIRDSAGDDPGLADLLVAASELDAGWQKLSALSAPQTRAALEAERAELLAQVANADALTAEAWQGALDALSARLDTLNQAGAAAARLDARLRALLHQLESLRLSALHAKADATQAPDLSAQVRELRRAADARTEVDQALAAARRASAATRSAP